jgi:hypothetical protein
MTREIVVTDNNILATTLGVIADNKISYYQKVKLSYSSLS